MKEPKLKKNAKNVGAYQGLKLGQGFTAVDRSSKGESDASHDKTKKKKGYAHAK